MSMRPPTGPKGEETAAQYLKKKGYKIIERNFRTPFGEIDIIAEDGRTVVFVEVKTRLTNSRGAPSEAVNWRKRNKIEKCALYYSTIRRPDAALRFDVIGIDAGRVEHIKDAFEAQSQR